MEEVFRVGVGTVAGPYAGWPQHGLGARKAGGYRNGYYERGFATVFGTIRLRIARGAAKEFSAARSEAFAAAGAGIGDANSGGVSTRAVDAASGAGGVDVDGRSGERTDRVAADSRPGRGGGGVSPRASGRGMGVLVLGWSEPAGAAADGTNRVQMLVAYGVRRDGQRQLLAFLRSQGETRAKLPGRACWETCIGADCKART